MRRENCTTVLPTNAQPTKAIRKESGSAAPAAGAAAGAFSTTASTGAIAAAASAIPFGIERTLRCRPRAPAARPASPSVGMVLPTGALLVQRQLHPRPLAMGLHDRVDDLLHARR